MIRVTVELVSAVSPDRDRLLGVMTIANTGPLDKSAPNVCGYDVRLSKWAPQEKITWRSGKVTKFDRVQRGPWDLMYLCLRATVARRNP